MYRHKLLHFFGAIFFAALISGCGGSLSVEGTKSSESSTQPPTSSAPAGPGLGGLFITNFSPTNSTTFNLLYGSTTGSPTEYCLNENNTDSSSCSWQAMPLPSTFAVNATNGAKVLSAWVRDADGNVSGRVDSQSILLDTVGPAAPSAGATNPASGSASQTIFVRGTSSADTVTVRLYDGATCTNMLGASSKEVFESGGISVFVPAASTTNIHARAYDYAGNASSCASLVSYIHVPPGGSTTLSLGLISITPASPSSNAAPVVKGWASTDVVTVDFYSDATCSTFVSSTSKATFSGTGAAVNMTANSTNLLFAKGVDGSANTSPCTYLSTFVHDSVVPAWSPTITHASSYNSLSSSPVFSWQNNATDTNGVSQYEYAIGTANNVGAPASQIDILNWTPVSQTNLQATGLTLSQGTTYYVNMRARDYAGNYSAVMSSTGWIADTLGPAVAPTITGSNPTSPSSATSSPLLSGTSSADTITVQLYKDSSCSLQVGSGSKASFEGAGLLASLSANTTSSVYTRAVDAAGNQSACSVAGFSYTHDDMAPILTGLTVANSNPTRFSTYNLSWGSLIGSPVEYCILQNDVTVGNCSWQALPVPTTYAVTGGDGAKVLSAWVRDSAGNVSARVDSNSVTLDTTAPSLASAGATVPAGSGETVNPLVRGALDTTAATVELYSDSGCSAGIGLGSRDNFVGVGILVTVFSSASTSIYAKTIDAAGNASACHSLVSYTHTPAGGGGTTPQINLQSAALSVDEGVGVVSLGVVLTQTRSVDTTISYTIGGTSSNPLDHSAANGSVTIPAFSNTASISLPIFDDPLLESDETLTVTLGSPPSGVALGSITIFTLTIRDNDEALPATLMNQVSSVGVAEHICAVVGGALFCWGRNSEGQLGDGTTNQRTRPAIVAGFESGVTKVSVGVHNTCAIKNGAAFCWGDNGNGEIGDGTTTNRLVPTAVVGMSSGVTDIDIDGYAAHTCAIQNGSLKCWGYNGWGNLGDGTTTERWTPTPVVGLDSDVSKVSVTSSYESTTYAHRGTTCAIHKGAAKCWGHNGWGQIGDGTGSTRILPTQVVGLTSGVTDISVGEGIYGHACAVHKGAAKCWGNGGSGQLGNGGTASSNVPVQVNGMTANVTRVEAFATWACGIMNGELRCWGVNSNGNLGDTTTSSSSNPVQVYGMADNVEMLSTGSYDGNIGRTTCATRLGILYCWGKNNFGQVGDGSLIQRNAPVRVLGINYNGASNITKVAAGHYHSCAVHDGSLKCWGLNDYGQLGTCNTNARYSYAQAFGLNSGVTDVVLSRYTTCALVNGGVRCFGHNGQGQMGIGVTGGDYSCPQTPTGMGDASGVTKLGTKTGPAGYEYMCAIQSGALKCWGSNSYGQLGVGDTTLRNVPTQVVGMTSGVTDFSLSDDNNGSTWSVGTSCAIKDGGAFCWGYNGYGQVGDGTTTQRNSPVQVTGLTSGVTQIVTRGWWGHTCAVVSGGLKCWGRNNYGQLGTGNTTDYSVPMNVTSMGAAGSGVTKVSISSRNGYGYTCAIQNGAVKCWGYNGYGQLGDGTYNVGSTQYNPQTVVGLPTDVVDVVTSDGQYGHTCSEHADGAVRCWGFNNRGQLGTGDTTNRNTPFTVFSSGGTLAAVPLDSGDLNYTLILRNGQLFTMGRNDNGQLADGWTTNQSLPRNIVFYTEPANILRGVLEVAAGKDHSCSLIDGGVKCWGANAYGQLGDGTTSASLTPVTPTGLADGVTEIEIGHHYSCAVRLGAVRCWGRNDQGQLGNNSTVSSSVPVTPTGLASNATLVSAGVSHTCAVQGGRPHCWGLNSFGQLGNGNTTPHLTPQAVTGLTDNTTSISVGALHTCSVEAGTGYCWGFNGSGRLGNGTSVSSSTPSPVFGFSDRVSQIFAGESHSCGIQNSGAFCWGLNSSGQLGDTTTIARAEPTPVSTLSTGVTQISTGYNHSCAIKAGQVRCWGSNSRYQLGVGTGASVTSPQTVTAIFNMLGLSLGADHSCAMQRNGIWCWGANEAGQVGNGFVSDQPVPDRAY